MQIQEIINHIAAGESVAAKESIENVLSAKAFDALQGRKQEMAATIFGGQEQSDEEVTDGEEAYAEEVEHDGEQLDELSKATLKRYATKASDSYHAAEVHKAKHKPRTYSYPSPTNWDHKVYLDNERTKATKIMKKRAKGIGRVLNRTNPGWDKD